MSTLMYATGGRSNRFYKIVKKKDVNTNKDYGEVSRITCAEYDNPSKNTIGLIKPNVGDTVIIIIKPYHEYICKKGVILNVLTSKAIHTRGHKVRIISKTHNLETIYIGRTLKIL
jgi:hypothetical protein